MNRICAHSAMVSVALAAFAFFPLHATANPETSPKFAVLIGISRYPNLGPGEQLSGSANDVAAMQDLLISRFGFPASQITTLTDDHATGQGIRAAFAELISAVQALPTDGPPAQVVVHFSGHGSQVPDQESGHPDRDESDGLDETWVPFDATRQAGPEDILDDELNSLLNQVCANGRARLLMVFDCCHSGTGARGATSVRQLTRGNLRAAAPTPDAPVSEKKLPHGAVFLSACRAQEQEPEFRDDDGRTYGLLTRFLVQVLSQERVVSQLSYDLLQRSIVSGYISDGRVMRPPIPQIEGVSGDLQSTVLGFGPDVDRPPYYEVEIVSPEAVRVKAGSFHDISPGALLELYENPEDVAAASADNSLVASVAWLRINQVDGASSTADVIRWDDDDQTRSSPFRLPTSMRSGMAVLRRRGRGNSTLRLRIVHVQSDGSDGPALGPDAPELPAVFLADLRATRRDGETPWFTWVTDDEASCTLLLRIAGNSASLFPATGMASVSGSAVTGSHVPPALRGGWGPFDVQTGNDGSHPPQGLTDYLRRIARANNLISLAQRGDPSGTSDYSVRLDLVEVEANRNTGVIAAGSERPILPQDDGRILAREDQIYTFQVTNLEESGTPIHVTLLKVSPNMGIERVLPYAELPQPVRLEPGEVRLIPDPYESTDDADFGVHRVILLATREPTDFSFIEQRDLPATRGGSLSGGAGSLTGLLQEQTFFQPAQTRGRIQRKKSADTSWHSQVLTFETVRSE